MRKFFYVAVHENYTDLLLEEAEIDPTLLSYREFQVPESDAIDRVALAANDFYRTRGVHPERILLGWETWLQLGWEMSESPGGITEFRGIPVSVTERQGQHIEMIPVYKDVRFP